VRATRGGNKEFRITESIITGTKELGIGESKVYYLWRGTGRSNDTKDTEWKYEYKKMNLTETLNDPVEVRKVKNKVKK